MSLYDDDNLYDAGADDDILKRDKSKSNYKLPQHISGHMPGYLQEALERFVQEHPDMGDELYSHALVVPRSVHLFMDLTSNVAKTATTGKGSAPFRALIDIMDEMTEGEVTRRTKLYDLERLLTTQMLNLYATNKLHQAIYHSNVIPTPSSGEFMLYLSRLIDIQMFCIDELKAEYVGVCEMQGKEPNPTLLEDGYIEFADLGLASTLPLPTYKYHHEHGDVTRVRDSYESALDTLSRALIETFSVLAKEDGSTTT